MIIGFDGSRAFRLHKTGTENYSYQLLKALAKIDQKNTYVVYLRSSSVILNPAKRGEGSLDLFQNESGDSSLIAQNDNMVWPGNFKFKVINFPRLWTQIGLAKETFKDNLDVLFIPAHTLPLIHKPGLKTVVTVHDLGAEYLPKMHQIKQRLYLKWITKFQLRSAAKLIAVSEATKEDLVKKVGIEPKKIEVIYEGYDGEKFQIPNSKFQKDALVSSLRQYRLVPGEYFLFVGTVQPRKNLTKVIHAFNHFCHPERLAKDLSRMRVSNKLRDSSASPQNDSINLIIAGQKGWLAEKIYKLPKKLGIENRVKFLGYVPDKDLPALYSGAIALVSPSLFEGFGLPILEAQACGCPVITSNVSSMPEISGKGALLVNPYSVDDIVRGMREIGEIRGIREKLIKAGYENIKRFSWEKCARETLAVLENI